MFEYKCKLVRVIDGDTVDIDIDLGFGVWLRKQRIRMYGIDTPESRTRDLEEKKYGLAAKEFLQKWTGAGELWTFDTNINEKMIERHHAVRYHGQSKKEIQEDHIKNRELVEL